MAPRHERDVDAAPRAGRRQRVQHPVVVRHAQHFADVPAVGDAVAMRDHRALRERRRARRVQEREDVVRPGGPRGRGGFYARNPPAQLDDIRQAVAAGIRVVRVHDDVAERGEPGARELAGDRRGQLGQHRVERVEIVDPAEAVGDEERPRLRLPEDVRQLVGLVARVQRDDDRAETRARILGEEPLGPVR